MTQRSLTYFLSDAHLGAAYIPDARLHESLLVAFLQSVAPTAKNLYLMGDILDYWFEYRHVVPRGYVRFFGQLAAMADAGTHIVWYTGNHDIWLFDYLKDEIGIEVRDTHKKGGEFVDIDGTRFFLGHGDRLGRPPRGYVLMNNIFHNRFLQRLYAMLPPSWTIPFAHRWSAHSRKSATTTALSGKTRTNLETECRRMASANPDLRYIVIGHHHVALDEPISPHCRLIILGDWIHLNTYAVFDGTTLSLDRFDAKK